MLILPDFIQYNFFNNYGDLMFFVVKLYDYRVYTNIA